MDLSNFSKEYSSLISKLEEARKSLNTFKKETEECLKSLLPHLFSPKDGEKDLVGICEYRYYIKISIWFI